MNILHTYSETIVDGDGIRYSIYFAGCPHRCKGCHNPKSRDPNAGTPLTDQKLDDIIKEINNNPLLDGITLSGGDPFYNSLEMLPIVQKLKNNTKLSIWCYTGYTYEELLQNDTSTKILEYIDVLIDGPFIEDKYSPILQFRGSSNQRIIKIRHNI